MSDRIDLESAILDAEGAAAVLEVLEDKLRSSTKAGWEALKLREVEGLSVVVSSSQEFRALTYASQNLQDAIAEVSRVFYAAVEARKI